MKTKNDIHLTHRTADGLKEDGTPYKMLIVDASAFVVSQLSQILTSEGFEVAATASDGEEAVARYKELFPSIDCVTLDTTLPKMDGITALEKIVEFDPKARVVMVSASGSQDTVKACLMAGARNYLVKPLDRKKVLERLMTVFK